MQSIRHFFSKLEKLEPVATGLNPLLSKTANIKAVIFDIYGTLLISASGDINAASLSTHNLKIAFEASKIKIKSANGTNKEERLKSILGIFFELLNEQHKKSKDVGVLYPEIDILKIWTKVIGEAESKNWLQFQSDSNIKYMTVIFEILSNRVYPMPGMKEVLEKLTQMDIPLGVVSNAQFYTTIILNYFLNGNIEEKEELIWFDPDLTVYSYKFLKAKPDHTLFIPIINNLNKKYNIKPENTLFIGNDMLNDIYPAQRVGMKTALFAGDRRSLRLREDNNLIKGIKPDFILTELNQIFKLF